PPPSLNNGGNRFSSSQSLRAVALEQITIHSAHRLRLCTDTAARTLLRVPAVKIDVQPVGRFGDEALEEQRTEDRAGESRGRNVAEVRHLAAELVVVAHPQRHGPQR